MGRTFLVVGDDRRSGYLFEALRGFNTDNCPIVQCDIFLFIPFRRTRMKRNHAQRWRYSVWRLREDKFSLYFFE